MSRRMTQRNLYSALALVDRKFPEKSQLLTVPSAPHGNADTAVFGDYEKKQYQQLLDWVRQIAEGKRAPKLATIGKSQNHLLRFNDNRAMREIYESSSSDRANQASHSAGTPAAEDVHVDPFDPEVFNRRFFQGE